MSLNKAIAQGKEHRKPYGKTSGTYAKSVDCTCRNHGSCYWCMKNRLHNTRKKEYAMMEAMKEQG